MFQRDIQIKKDCHMTIIVEQKPFRIVYTECNNIIEIQNYTITWSKIYSYDPNILKKIQPLIEEMNRQLQKE